MSEAGRVCVSVYRNGMLPFGYEQEWGQGKMGGSSPAAAVEQKDLMFSLGKLGSESSRC